MIPTHSSNMSYDRSSVMAPAFFPAMAPTTSPVPYPVLPFAPPLYQLVETRCFKYIFYYFDTMGVRVVS